MKVVLDASTGIEIALGRENSLKYKDLIEKASLIVSSDLYKAEEQGIEIAK